MAEKEFYWNEPGRLSVGKDGEVVQLSAEVLGRNARWFIQVRWCAGLILLLYYCTGFLPAHLLSTIGIVSQGNWSLVLALVLLFSNTVLYAFSRNAAMPTLSHPMAQIWAQIILDLIGITMVVHFCGSTGTPAPFLYILHISLACVFFSIRISLLVAIISTLLYGACILAEFSGVVARHSIFILNPRSDRALDLWFLVWHVLPIMIMFFILWYMLSHLSKIIRMRESQLIRAYDETRHLQVEKDRYAVQMTHQLKSPLDAIRSNIALLTQGYMGPLNKEVMATLQKIDSRAHGLARSIIDVLKLSRLNAPLEEVSPQTLEISVIVRSCLDELRTLAEQRKIRIEDAIAPVTAFGVAEHLQLLIVNIISNAITYSFEGGRVLVSCGQDQKTGQAVLTVTDQGIGIPADKLPHIFEEYFRTTEAVNHNSASTGIGLAIVKKVAQTYGIVLKFVSEIGHGTAVTAFFPVAAPAR